MSVSLFPAQASVQTKLLFHLHFALWQKGGGCFWGCVVVVVVGGGHSCNPAYQLQPLLLKRNNRKNWMREKKEWERAARRSWFMVKRGTVYGLSEVREAFSNRGLCQWRKILVLFFDQNSEWYLYFKPCSRAWEVDVWTVSRRRISSYPHRRGWSGLQPPVRSPIQQTTKSGQPQYLAVKRNRRTQILAPFWHRQKAV